MNIEKSKKFRWERQMTGSGKTANESKDEKINTPIYDQGKEIK